MSEIREWLETIFKTLYDVPRLVAWAGIAGMALIVFAGFSVLVLKESLTWKHGLGFALIAAGAAVIFYKPGAFS